MKTHSNESVADKPTITRRCVQSCKKLLGRIQRAKNKIASEFQETNRQLVHLALNEAEALAWQTAYPHLFFPSLAMEKVQAVATWQTRQRSVQRLHSAFAEAA